MPAKDIVTLQVTERELATILAALRFYQRDDVIAEHRDAAILDIATNGGSFPPLDEDEVDRLCEALNTTGL